MEPVTKAKAFLGGEKLEPKAVVALERDLVAARQRALAQDIHAAQQTVDDTRAKEVLSSGGGAPRELLALAKRRATDRDIGVARRLLIRARQRLSATEHSDIFAEVFQKSALYTSKDPDLPVAWRLEKALEILGLWEDLDKTLDCETLGIAGGIHKRKWEVDSGRHHLERSLFYYLRGYSQGAPETHRANVLGYLAADPVAVLDASKDRGYTGINAAFILDLLASQEEVEATRAGMHSEAAKQRRQFAQRIRAEILSSVPPLAAKSGNEWLQGEWWYYATIGEAHFGLGRDDPAHFDEAVEWLVTKPAGKGLLRSTATKRCVLDVPDWEYESTARQLARLSLLQGPPGQLVHQFQTSKAGLALKAILQQDDSAVRSAFEGKVGLALSGGGFRASLFHIGVLASLAEHGVLPRVEVLSCVSGGSIVGAHYYLEVRHLLQTSADETMPEKYVAIVERLEETFLQGVQRNIRTRVLAEWSTNLRMLFMPGYSRTLRLGELYERELFSRVPDGGFEGPRWLPDWLAVIVTRKGKALPRKRWLNALLVQPPGYTKERPFVPRTHNWRRVNKVPTLILNATSLNSGHGWQFTASFMGEPPTPINTAIDANDRLRRMYYDDAPEKHQKVRLGHAVAASSCVPGLFEPLILDGLFENQSVRLVDGGVCDNQGVASLLEQDCTVMLVSDASGQMDSQPVPSASLIGVPLRANAILQARVREAQYTDVATRHRSMLLRGLMFLHLKQDIPARPLPWMHIPSERRVSDFEPSLSAENDQTPYGIATATQQLLAAIRTDLDSFSDVEAYALMASGYKMANKHVEGLPGFGAKVAEGDWTFMKIADALTSPHVRRDIPRRRAMVERILGAGSRIAFKVWKLLPLLRVVKWLLAAVAVTFLALGFFAYRGYEIGGIVPVDLLHTTFGAVVIAILSWIGLALLAVVIDRVLGERYGKYVMKAIQPREALRSILVGLCMATGGFLVARLHLHVFDKLFLWAGRLDRLPKD